MSQDHTSEISEREAHQVRSTPLTGMRRAQVLYAFRAQMGAAGLHVGTHDLLEFVEDIIRKTNRDAFDSPRGNGSSNGNNFSESSSHGCSVPHGASNTEGISHSTWYAGTPSQSYAGDPVAIARQIFRDEVTDILKVLKNCGCLSTWQERHWCVLELWRLLRQFSSVDMP